MMPNISENELFSLRHIDETLDLRSFKVKKAPGLEFYLKSSALRDERAGIARTYVITDNEMIVAYFTLRSGLITVSRGLFKGFDTYTAIELANFAVNDNYKEANNNEIPKLGAYIFSTFIIPLVSEINKYLGAAYLYIFALPNDKLMSHYATMGFQKVDSKVERFIYRHVKPAYDRGCRFMYQKI